MCRIPPVPHIVARPAATAHPRLSPGSGAPASRAMRRTHASAITAGVVAHAFTATPMTVTPLEGGMHLHRHRSRLAAAAAVTAAVAGGGAVAAHDAAAATGCSVAYSVATQWQGGFTTIAVLARTPVTATNLA